METDIKEVKNIEDESQVHDDKSNSGEKSKVKYKYTELEIFTYRSTGRYPIGIKRKNKSTFRKAGYNYSLNEAKTALFFKGAKSNRNSGPLRPVALTEAEQLRIITGRVIYSL
jgi:hypothetical protein